VIAGGTDLCVYMAEGLCRPETLIDLCGIDSLRGVEIAADGTVRIGACTTIRDVAASHALPTCLRQGARAIGSPQIRNLGTIGGNICNASPCGDALTPLLALDARFVLRSAEGTRTVESAEFFTGPKQTVLTPDEILEAIELPPTCRGKASAFRMIGNRKGQAISQVNAAVSAAIAERKASDVRVAVGSVAPVPLRLTKLEQVLGGRAIADLTPVELRDAVLEGIRPIDDVRTTATYRQEVTVALVYDALTECGGQASARGEGAGAC
jgi:CO/xanthine dehydrogenase FAD-binding subunit